VHKNHGFYTRIGDAKMKSPEDIGRFRTKMIEYLEAALALTDETGDGTAGYMIEAALDTIRSEMWPANLDRPPSRSAQ
jgi:hypothetical protein